MKKLIVNADDFGISSGVNRGIEQAFQFGTLTSATVMANMPAFEDAVSIAKRNQGLGIGVHLNLLRGKPLLPVSSIPTLTNRDGYLVKEVGVFIKKMFLKKIELSEIEKELRAQIEKTLNAGIKVTHFDSEKHLHCYPAIFKIAVKLAKEYKINRLRYINESCLIPKEENKLNGTFRKLANNQYYKAKVLTYLCRLSRRSINQNKIAYPDHSYGIMLAGQMTKRSYELILESLNEGVSEFMCHPGYVDNELAILSKQIGSFFINDYREEELSILLDADLPQLIKKLNIKLVNYGEL